MRKLMVNLGGNSYNILIKKNLRKEFGKQIKNVFTGKKIAIITDNNLNLLYGNEVKENLELTGFEVKVISLEPGEKSKSFSILPYIYNELLDFKLTRSDLVISFGGGVIGDLGGFIASTFLRGVNFIQIPTSLLAQVDSSIGGKVGVDLERGKNLVGSFYHPKLVLIDIEILNTLPEKYFNDGLGEVIKYGCIKDRELYEVLEDLKDKKTLKENIGEIIYTCCDIKRKLVESDEKDTGERMLLNFGHTLGHAIEKVFNYDKYTHGQGVAIGMYMITKISEELELTQIGVSERIRLMLKKYELPYEINIENKEEILEAIKLDKKNLNNILNVILIKDIGEAFIHPTNIKFFN
ncbi:3-dehydroquinate synthase [Clostridium tarantellae]|uniref:3-dehydroquinate synthase n=1 Tax=Clostridium tarantellae TaxID=39493 RepID=A0A6I1MM25_9CLOT|nr:3-dehydroquinate synthase [Clostridium tarantellae]MPQ43167.1 3-dehydroquinate synthase [Clostridium tarantellae]